MASDIKAMSAELARNPTSPVYLELGEALRARGQLDAATRVALAGLERHPNSIEGQDLYARILADAGEFAQARRVWLSLLEAEPRHMGAHKGLGFLSFGIGDLNDALDHLESALAIDPMDPSVVRALRIVRETAEEEEAQEEEIRAAEAGQPVFSGLEGADRGLLLVDDRGRVLGGGVRDDRGTDASDAAAAYLAGAAQEAERTARLLGLGNWRWMIGEGPAGNAYVTQPAPDALLLIVRDRSVPAGRLTHLAERAADVARAWLERQRL